jgi:hypothetical protein
MKLRIRQLIAALQVGGGFAGMGLSSMLAMGQGLAVQHRIIIGLLGVPFAVCAYAGRELWRDNPQGYMLSALVQAAQIPAWSSPKVLYLFYCGAQLGLWFGRGDLIPMAALGGSLDVSWAVKPRGESLGINFLALWAFWQVIKGWSAGRVVAPSNSLDAPA